MTTIGQIKQDVLSDKQQSIVINKTQLPSEYLTMVDPNHLKGVIFNLQQNTEKTMDYINKNKEIIEKQNTELKHLGLKQSDQEVKLLQQLKDEYKEIQKAEQCALNEQREAVGSINKSLNEFKQQASIVQQLCDLAFMNRPRIIQALNDHVNTIHEDDEQQKKQKALMEKYIQKRQTKQQVKQIVKKDSKQDSSPEEQMKQLVLQKTYIFDQPNPITQLSQKINLNQLIKHFLSAFCADINPNQQEISEFEQLIQQKIRTLGDSCQEFYQQLYDNEQTIKELTDKYLQLDSSLSQTSVDPQIVKVRSLTAENTKIQNMMNRLKEDLSVQERQLKIFERFSSMQKSKMAPIKLIK